MTIIRTYHDKQNPYSLLNNQALFDPTLSNAARGLWAQCMARKDDWVFYMTEIQEHTCDGERKVYSQINELIEKGYVARIRVKQKRGGKWVYKGVDYVFFESKITPEKKSEFLMNFKKDLESCEFLEPKPKKVKQSKFKKCLSHRRFADVENADVQNAELVNTDRENTDLESNDISHPPLPPSKPEIPKRDDDDFSFLEDTVLSPRNRETLRSRYSPEQVKRALKISESIKVKTTLMRLLVHILENPDKYEESELLTPQQALALRHNELIRHSNSKLADINENIIRNFETMYIICGNERHSQATQISLKNPLDEVKKDIKLSEYLLNLAERDKDK